MKFFAIAIIALSELLTFPFSMAAENTPISQSVATQQTKIRELIKHPDVPIYKYKIIKIYPHNPQSFTEGLFLDKNGELYESSGLYQQSQLNRIDLASGQRLQTYLLPFQYFAEGIAIMGDKIYQLTYQSKIGFIYDKKTFKLEKTFHYASEGWGLTTDGTQLIMSDGSNIIRFLDPKTFKIQRTLFVHDQVHQIYFINALQYIDGKIFANIWHSEVLAIISPTSGEILAWVDLTGINPDPSKLSGEYVLNGIAYDKKNQTILITGKNWPYLYAIQLIK